MNRRGAPVGVEGAEVGEQNDDGCLSSAPSSFNTDEDGKTGEVHVSTETKGDPISH